MCRLYLGSFPQITIRYYYWYQLIIRNSEKLFKKIRMKFKFKTDNNSNKGGGGTSSSLGTLSRFKSKFKIKFNIQNLSIKNFFLRILYPTLNSFPNMLCIWAGFGIVSYIIYVRLILQRLPRELFIKDISIISIIIYFNLFATFFILSTISGYKVYKEHFNKEKVNKEKEGENQGVNGKIERILVWLKGKGVKISNFYTLCLLKFDKAFKNIIYKIFNVNRVLLPEYALNFMNKFVPLSRYNIIIITFAVMPKVIIIASLLMDIFIFHKLNYFYICGPLYLIPLGFDWIVHTLVQAPLDALRAADKLIVTSKDTVLHSKNLRVVPESDYYLQNKSQDIGNRLAKDNGNDKNIVNYYECVYSKDFFSQDPEEAFRQQRLIHNTHNTHNNLLPISKLNENPTDVIYKLYH